MEPIQRVLAPASLMAVLALAAAWAAGAGGSEEPAGQPDEAARLAARSAAHPFDDELRLLAQDLTSPVYRQVLETMIPTDLQAEWQRVATTDNYMSFAARHGGKEKVEADPKLKAAYEVRRDIAMRFAAIVREAFEKRKQQAPFDEQAVEALCAEAGRTSADTESGQSVPVRVVMPAPGAERHWPRFRGPTGQGTASDESTPLHWSAEENVAWKVQVPGSGNSSPVVWGDRVFLTSASPDGRQRWVLCYALADGKLLWQRDAPEPEALETPYQKNTFASSTVVTDGQLVFAFLGNSGLVCFDVEGNFQWKADVGPFPTGHGPGSSPALYRDKLILIQDQNNTDSVFVAIEKHSGKLLWKKSRDQAMCWSSPVVVRAGNHDELLFNGSHFLIGYDPETGDELWRVGGTSREAIPTLVIGGGLIFSASGRNGPIMAIRPGGRGDVTDTHVVWRLPRGGPHVPSPVYVDGRLYLINDVGIATCLEATTGKMLWQKRLPGRYSMSPIAAGDRVLITSETGTTYVIKAGPEFEQLAANELGEGVLATPAVIGPRLYFRTAEHLVAIGQSPSGAAGN